MLTIVIHSMKQIAINSLLVGGMLWMCACNQPKQTDNDAAANRKDDTTHDAPAQDSVTYQLIHATDSIPGHIDDGVASQLKEPMKALAAFYAAMGGTGCDGEKCKLTTALGLGRQGSAEHKKLIANYFPNDKVANTVLAQDCYLRPSGASSFSDFANLRFTEYGDTVRVDYKLLQYNQGKETWTEGPDLYTIQDNKFHKVQRNLWIFAEEGQ